MITARKEVTKKGTIPNTSNDNFNSLPSFVRRVKININPVKVRYLHFTKNLASDLKNGSTDKYEKKSVIIIENDIAFNVNIILCKVLSIKSFVLISFKIASPTGIGLGINPLEAKCQNSNARIIWLITIIINVCLLIFPKGLKIFFMDFFSKAI